MKRDDTIYLKHILDAILRVEKYLQDVNMDRFFSDLLLQDGVIRQIEIMGEAAKRVSFEYRTAHPCIPWEDMAGMRDKLIHDYFGVDIEKVWLTTREDLPELKKQIQDLLE